MTRRVLIVAYYWPPAGGGGVQRWLKFARYLPEFGWHPVLFVPEGADYPDTDESLVAETAGIEVIRFPIWEPYTAYRRFTGQQQTDKVDPGFFQQQELSWKKRLAIWVRGNFFIPDARRFWVRPAVKFLRNYLKDNPVDVIVTTGTPHSLHLIGLGLKRTLGLPWVADFRDPWTTIEFYDQLRLSNWADRRHRALEKAVMTTADHVTSASWAWAEDYRALGAKAVTTLTNGFDEADFAAAPPAREEKFVLLHAGTLAGDRNPEALWRVLEELCEEEDGFRESLIVRFAGKTDMAVIRSMMAHRLGDQGEDLGYVPHAEAIELMQTASLLLLLINQVGFNARGRIAGKVFEYLASGTPVLCIAPLEGDSARIVSEAGAGYVCPFGDKAALKAAILDAWQRHRAGQCPAIDPQRIAQFSRRAVTEQLGEVLNQVKAQK